MPIFEPYQENLPLQSGFYSFLIDESGHFRVERGQRRHHSSMVPGGKAAAAGRFRVNRMGRVVHVDCQSLDYVLYQSKPDQEMVQYIIYAFENHKAFDTHPQAIFTFHRPRFESWHISADGARIPDYQARLDALLDEGAGDEIPARFSPRQIEAFRNYVPLLPPKLYSMQKDQLIVALEDGPDGNGFQYGPALPPFSLDSEPLRSGKNNFVINQQGWLIIGMTGHQILSGGEAVGGAGHIHIDTNGVISRIELNFSGHYRPSLTADYARYVYQTIAGHPLLTLSPHCEFAGRIFIDLEAVSKLCTFTRQDLESDDPDLDIWIASL